METQICAGACGLEKPLADFGVDKRSAKHWKKCLDCRREEQRVRVANWRKKNRPSDWQPKYKSVECLGDKHACTTCGDVKPHHDFYQDKTGACGFESRCKSCRGQDRRDRWAENKNGCKDREALARESMTPEERSTWLAGMFIYRLEREFNITERQYNWLLEQQNGVCALCEEPETRVHPKSGVTSRLSVDHDHRCCAESAKSCGCCIRGLLCHACNMMMGKVEVKPALTRLFSHYVDRRPLRDYISPELEAELVKEAEAGYDPDKLAVRSVDKIMAGWSDAAMNAIYEENWLND